MKLHISILILILFCLASFSSGGLYRYNDVNLEYDRLLFRECGMYSPDDAPENGGMGSFIKLTDLKFTRQLDSSCIRNAYTDATNSACNMDNGVVDIAFVEHSFLSSIGAVSEQIRYYCCTDDAINAGACTKKHKNSLIVGGENAKKVILRRLEIPIDGGSELSDPDEGIFQITSTGMYQIIFANCDPVNGVLEMNGHTEWMNPYGYLPGEMYHALPYFKVLSILYIILGIFWYGSSCVAFKSLQAIHFWTSLVLLLGMVETAAKYYDYYAWNTGGSREEQVMAFGLVFGVTKRTLSRILVVMIAMGYGVVRPTLGPDFKRLVVLGGSYWVLCVLSEYVQGAPREDEDITSEAMLVSFTAILVMLSAVIDVVFYGWTFHALSDTISQLQAKNQHDRARPYRCFMVVLIVAMAFSTVWALFGIMQKVNEMMDKNWELDWAVVAIWEVVYLYLLIAICILLRPRLSGAYFFGYSAVELFDRGNESSANGRNGRYDEELEFGGRKLSADDEEFELAPIKKDEDLAFKKGRLAD